MKSLGRARQTVYDVINFLKDGNTACDYYERYNYNKKRCDLKITCLSHVEKDFNQIHLNQSWSLEVRNGTYPDRISRFMRTLNRLADRGILKKEDLP